MDILLLFLYARMNCSFCAKTSVQNKCGNQCGALYCGQRCADIHWNVHEIHCNRIGLYAHLPANLKRDYRVLSEKQKMWMHGTRTAVFVFMKYMSRFGLEPGLYSSGTLYKHHIYPMTGALAGDFTSQQNVGKEVLSGVLNTSGETLDRNVYYTTYGEDTISRENLAETLRSYLQRIQAGDLYGGLEFQKIFGYISRLRYWDNDYYNEHLQSSVREIAVPHILEKLRKVSDTKVIQLVENAIRVIIEDSHPIFELSTEDKEELTTTYPLIFASAEMANSAIKAGSTAEPDEHYVKQLLMRDVDVIYTSSSGCMYVKNQMRLLGNTHVQVICTDQLFKDSDTLTGWKGQFKPPKKEREELARAWKNWKTAASFWNNDKDDWRLSELMKQTRVEDFSETQLSDVMSFFKTDLNWPIEEWQAQQLLDYANELLAQKTALSITLK